jgi:streptogramin lyase
MFLLNGMLKCLSLITSVVMLLSVLGAPAWADITEFPVTGPNSGDLGFMTVGPDGNIWFTELNFFSTGRGNKIGRISPQDPGDGSTIAEFELPNSDSWPAHVTVGPDNSLWFTESTGSRIGKITVDGQITEFDLPDPNSRPVGITLGPDGNLWFTERDGNRIGVITPDGQILHEFPVTTLNSGPAAISLGPDGNLWFTENSGQKIGRITVDGTITEFVLPHGGSDPFGITEGPDGNLWFTENDGIRIGRITPDGVLTEFDFPNSTSPPRWPVTIKTGPDGNLWFTEWGGNAIGQMTTGGVLVTEYNAPTRNSNPRGLTVGPEGNIWFTEASGNKIGRLRAPADRLRITATPNAVSGTPFDITLTALGSWGNIDTGYQGTVTFSSTDPDSGVGLPADYWFTTGVGGDYGIHTLTVTLLTVGDQTLTVTDKVSGITGSATITVGPGP